jgi:hypothetical protein
VFIWVLFGSQNDSCYISTAHSTNWLVFRRFSQNNEKRLLAASCLSFPQSVRLSIRPSVRMEHLGSHWIDLDEILYKCFAFKKNRRENSSFSKIRNEFFLERELFQTKLSRKSKPLVLCSITFFSENRAPSEVMSKSGLKQRGHRWQIRYTLRYSVSIGAWNDVVVKALRY